MPARMELFRCLYVVHPWRGSRNPASVLIRGEARYSSLERARVSLQFSFEADNVYSFEGKATFWPSPERRVSETYTL